MLLLEKTSKVPIKDHLTLLTDDITNCKHFQQ